ncbi:hypothetical protein Noda2021_00370 [Candidatus Dependentiae bacterium Noda2021]|nr:hypothetical protein Noda2021_00370 [Candidatus Dependentiae bacterium Noda2021]
MNSTQSRPGFILVFSLILTALAVFLITYLASKSMLYLPYAQFMSQQQKATVLAYGALQLGLSQLAEQPKKDEKIDQKPNTSQEKNAQTDDQKSFLEKVLPLLNHWQSFVLTEKVEGIDGQVKLCITCEEGKLNLNELYDFKNHQFVGEGAPTGDAKKILQELFGRIEQMMGGKNVFASFEKFMKERTHRLNDVTELLMIKEFEVFRNNVFFEPTAGGPVKDKNRSLYLTDLFTVWSGKKTLEPWLFSNSINHILGLRPVSELEAQTRTRTVQEVVKIAKTQYNWAVDWAQYMRPLYEKEFSALPAGVGTLLSTQVMPTSFSITADATVRQNTVRLVAIVDRAAVQEQNAPTRYDVTIKKLYML